MTCSRYRPTIGNKMKTWTTETWIATEPADVLALMTEPEAIARWAPVPY
jgi:hypothetical protein